MEAVKRACRNLIRRVRFHDPSRLFWWRGPPYNAGDWIGPYLFEAISGTKPRFDTPSNRSLHTVFLTVGSIAEFFRENSIVWGSGIRNQARVGWRPCEIHAVRGPYTRERMLQLGSDCPEIYGDPAILMPLYYEPKPVQQEKWSLGIIPHYSHFEKAKAIAASNIEIKVIDIRSDLESVINEILTCEYILSSSLHGLILSHAYKIPGGWIKFSGPGNIHEVKYRDYFLGANIMGSPEPLTLQGGMPIDELTGYVSDCPQPDLTPLIQPLLDSCPFSKLR